MGNTAKVGTEGNQNTRQIGKPKEKKFTLMPVPVMTSRRFFYVSYMWYGTIKEKTLGKIRFIVPEHRKSAGKPAEPETKEFCIRT